MRTSSRKTRSSLVTWLGLGLGLGLGLDIGFGFGLGLGFGLDVEQLGHHRRARDLRPHRIARCDHTRQLVHGRTWLGLGLG